MLTNIGSFQQTSSVLKRLNWVIILVVFSFVIELVGLFLSSNLLVENFSSIHMSNRLFDATVTTSESLEGAMTTLNKASTERTHLGDLYRVYQANYAQAHDSIDSALQMSNDSAGINNHLKKLKEKLETFNTSSNHIFSQEEPTPMYFSGNVDLLVAQEYKLELDELLRKTQLLVKEEGANAFETVYRLRYLPLLVTLLITFFCVSFTILTGGAIIRRLRKSVDNLMEATKVVVGGNLSYHAKIIENDELGWFTFAFNQMIEKVAQLYQEARYAVQIRDDFLSIASHELRTPITPLKLQIQSIIRLVKQGRLAQLPPEQILKMLSITDLQISRLTKLTDDLLDVTRITSGKIDLRKERADISKMMSEIITKIRSELYAQKYEITMNLQPGLFVEMDLSRIEQVFTNLLSNAMKYGEGKPIEVTTSRTDPHSIEVRVQDHGQGIALADQERIFGRFERAAPSANFGGLGLGLYIVKQIVEQHLGTVRVESSLGDGSAFIVSLPSEMAVKQ